MDRALASGAKGPAFESRRARHEIFCIRADRFQDTKLQIGQLKALKFPVFRENTLLVTSILTRKAVNLLRSVRRWDRVMACNYPG
jgi:hypothetical protein